MQHHICAAVFKINGEDEDDILCIIISFHIFETKNSFWIFTRNR